MPRVSAQDDYSASAVDVEGVSLMPMSARRACHCGLIQPCPQHAKRSWDHKGRSRQERGLDAEYDRNRPRVLREEENCGICGGPGQDDDTVDHIVPRAHGGPSARHNLQRAHRECNKRKGGRA